jgi:hypothetical protein
MFESIRTESQEQQDLLDLLNDTLAVFEQRRRAGAAT